MKGLSIFERSGDCLSGRISRLKRSVLITQAIACSFLLAGCAWIGGGVTSLHPLPSHAVHPVWSPDGERLAFESDLAGNWDIWTMKIDGSDLKQITNGHTQERFASWSPDGTRITFASDRSGNWDVWVMNSDGSGIKQITRYEGLDIAPVWSPDGEKIAFVSSRSMDVLVWVIDPSGKNVEGMPNIRCGDWVSSWSPDSRTVAAVSSMRGASDIWLIDVYKRQIQQITQKTETRRDFLPAWSPDGSKIAFVSERNGKRDIYMMDPDGGNERRLTRGALGLENMPYDVDREVFDGLSFLYLSWSPDGKQLAFTRVNGKGKGELAFLTVK